MSKWNNPKTDQLIGTILALKNPTEARIFLRDLMTEPEIIEFSNRWQAAKMLNSKVSYLDIEKKTGLSSATIARVSQWLNRGMGGYKLMLGRLNQQHHPGLG